MKEKIIDAAESLFLRYGVRSVSMDDVARVGSISKKTIYQHFNNKDELVKEVAIQYMSKDQKRYSEIENSAENTIAELFLISKCMRENIMGMNPSLLYDLQKYHPEAFDVFVEHKEKFIKEMVIRNIERGKKEGNFRSDVNSKVMAVIRVEQIQMIFDERIFPKADFDFVEVQMDVFDHYIRGMLTDAGRELFNQYQKQAKPILK